MGRPPRARCGWIQQDQSPIEFYQYWRNVGDSDVLNACAMLTFLPLVSRSTRWTSGRRPAQSSQGILAFELTKLVHGEEEAQKAQDAAKALFAQGRRQLNVPTTTLDTGDRTDGGDRGAGLMLKCGLVPSKKERLAAWWSREGGGVGRSGGHRWPVPVTAEQLSGEGIMLKKGERSSTVRCSVNEKGAGG